MGFRIRTNVAALNAHNAMMVTNRNLNNSLEKLSTGLRINKAADDASGLQIADSLKNQADSLGQAIRNANDAIGVMQIADKGMDEQVKILDTIKVKATQAAQDGQTEETRKALQEDITRLMEELDNIAQTTSYNGKKLLSGQFTDQKFQIGAYSNETITASIGPTSSDKIGDTRFETGKLISGASEVKLTFKAVYGLHDITLESVKISHSAGTGIGVLAETINKNSEKLGVRASWQVLSTASAAVGAGEVKGLKINGITIGDIKDVKANDADSKLVAAINKLKDQTGVEAFVDNRGHLNLRSVDGRGIEVKVDSGNSVLGLDDKMKSNYGRLSLVRQDARDIVITGQGASSAGFGGQETEATINLRSIKGTFTSAQADAVGFFANYQTQIASQAGGGRGVQGGVVTLRGAMAVMDIADTAMKMLDKIRADIGSVQNQLVSTINNISVTQVNVKAAESQIRDVDFAAETANFQKNNLLAQAGSYAMSQANAAQQNVMRLLQ
ncbi:flagellin A [Caminibacter sp.]